MRPANTINDVRAYVGHITEGALSPVDTEAAARFIRNLPDFQWGCDLLELDIPEGAFWDAAQAEVSR